MSYRHLLALTVLLLAQSPAATAIDRQGNYTEYDFIVPGDEYALSTWQVTTARLNCRQRPGNTQPIIRTFSRNAPLTVKTQEGVVSNVGYLQMDSQGKPWLKRIFGNTESQERLKPTCVASGESSRCG